MILDKLSKEQFFEKALAHLLDENLLFDLKALRRNGRNDYPLPLLWKSVLAYFAYDCVCMEQLRRERESSPFLQNILPILPPPSSFSRFFPLLHTSIPSIEKLRLRLLEKACSSMKMGPSLAIGLFQDMHLLWDPLSGLPLLCETKEKGALQLLAKVKSEAPFLLSQAKYLIGDNSYEHLIEIAWDEYQLKPIIPLKSAPLIRHDFYDEKGAVYCSYGDQKKLNLMVFAGFEKKRNSLKYRCMANHYGISCGKEKDCPLWKGIRVPLSTDRKIFTPLPRSCYRWQSLFKEYETKEALQKALFPKPCRRKELRVRLYSLLLLSASIG